MAIQGYRDLVVWQKSVDLAVEVYDLTRAFPASERYGLTQQLRRAAVSVSSNIAEGSGRATTPDLIKFLSYSRGSVKETESLLTVSHRVGMVTEDRIVTAMTLTDQTSRMLMTLRSRLHSR